MAEVDRLLREENPPEGEIEGFIPQHRKEDGTYAKTGEGNPLPVKEIGGNTIDDPLSNNNLSPDQATLFNLDAHSRFVCFAIRFDRSTDFTVEVGYRADGTDNVLLTNYEQMINQEGVDRHVFRMEVDFPHLRIRLRNTGSSTVEVEYCQVAFL